MASKEGKDNSRPRALLSEMLLADHVVHTSSKPGASVMATWFSNAAIGLHADGYGKLLGEVTWTCSRVRSCLNGLYAGTLTKASKDFCRMGGDVHQGRYIHRGPIEHAPF